MKWKLMIINLRLCSPFIKVFRDLLIIYGLGWKGTQLRGFGYEVLGTSSKACLSSL